MKTFHYVLRELNGEQEYSYDYLIYAETIWKALEIADKHASEFYLSEPEKGEDGFEFFGGAIVTSVDRVMETTRETFIEDMMRVKTVGREG